MTSAAEQGHPESGADSPPAESAADTKSAGERSQGNVRPKELGGPTGPEPTRYGDWERAGRCVDF